MFGYIKPCKPEMKVREFDTFKAIYCGLCKQLSRVFGPFASLTLSYDFTFMATVSLAMKETCGGFKKCVCAANPLKKRACAVPCDDLTYCASAAMLMLYYKLKDDITDERLFKKLRSVLLFPFSALARRKARKLYPDADRILNEMMQKQAALEKDGCTSVDRAADPTAAALSRLCAVFSEDKTQQAVLFRFGYLVGRYVYFADAFDDIVTVLGCSVCCRRNRINYIDLFLTHFGFHSSDYRKNSAAEEVHVHHVLFVKSLSCFGF